MLVSFVLLSVFVEALRIVKFLNFRFMGLGFCACVCLCVVLCLCACELVCLSVFFVFAC